jgi:hypothetical protein
VFTAGGRYTSRGWTDWTEGFQYGLPLLVFELNGDRSMYQHARERIVAEMSRHLTHTGVHDHGFNNVSTYGNLLRLMHDGLVDETDSDRSWCEMALRVSGAVQAGRWTPLPGGLGFVHSFNGPHSLFADTIRSMRALALSHRLGHVLLGEQDESSSLLDRLLIHAETTARYNVYFGDGRDIYDEPGRVAHESIFNVRSGSYRCPSTQQGYSPFSTWTRGQAWILLGYAELLGFCNTMTDEELGGEGSPFSGRKEVLDRFVTVARIVADHYIKNTPRDGVPYWDTGAPGLVHLGDYHTVDSDPYNRYEPVDSSAAAIAAAGLLRLAYYLEDSGSDGTQYLQAGLTVARSLFSEPYLSGDEAHEGILLHSVYHRPNGWDRVAPGQSVPNGESTMWGDYHGLELAVLVRRLAEGRRQPQFFDIGRTGVAQ